MSEKEEKKMTSVRGRRHQQALRLTLPQSVGPFMNLSPISSSSSSSLASNSSSGSPAGTDTLSNLKKLSVLGSGNSGTVYKVSHNQIGAIYALKVIRFGEKDVKLIHAFREAEILQRVNSSEYVVKCFGVLNEEGGIGFLMEYMDRGSLRDMLNKKRKLSERAISWIARSVLEGVEYLHGIGIVHRDIKPSNLLLNGRGELKIADFGASWVVANGSCTHNDGRNGICAYVNDDQVKTADFGANPVTMNASVDQYACTYTHNNECNEICTYMSASGNRAKATSVEANQVVVSTCDDQQTHVCNEICMHVNRGNGVNANNDECAYTFTCTHNNTCNSICANVNTRKNLKITDFVASLVKMNVDSDQHAYACTCSHGNVCRGTRAYMSPERMDPEQWDGEQCDGFAGDIWSLGVVAMECYMGRFPLLKEDEKLDWMTLMCAVCFRENAISSALEMASPEFESFCRRCLERDWRKRGTLEELLLHPFVNKFDDSGVEYLLNSSD